MRASREGILFRDAFSKGNEWGFLFGNTFSREIQGEMFFGDFFFEEEIKGNPFGKCFLGG